MQDKKRSAQHNRKAKLRGTDGRAGDGQGSILRWTGIGRTVRLIKNRGSQGSTSSSTNSGTGPRPDPLDMETRGPVACSGSQGGTSNRSGAHEALTLVRFSRRVMAFQLSLAACEEGGIACVCVCVSPLVHEYKEKRQVTAVTPIL